MKVLPATQLPLLTRLIIDNLKANQRCVYLNGPPMVAGIRCNLVGAGLDLVEELNKGSLVLSSDDTHLVQGRFDAERMLDMLANNVNQR